MKQYLLFILFVALSYNIGFGQPCVDLSKQKQDLEKVITDIDNKSSDKAKLQQLVILFKPCVTPEELKNIRNTYLSLMFDVPQKETYKTIIKNILDANKLLCVNFKNNTQQGINKDYIADLDALLKEYEGLKVKNENANTYKGTPTENNYTVFNKIKSLLSDCVDGVTLKEIQDLNNSIVIENFGPVTTTFNANLKEIININSDLLQVQNIPPTIVENTPKTPVVEEMEKVEPEKSNFWTYMLYTLLLISILGNGYFLYKKSPGNFLDKFLPKKSKKKESQHKTPKKSDDVNQIQKIKTNKLEEDVTSLKRTLGEREIEVKDLKNQLKDANDKIQTLENLSKQAVQTIEKEPIVSNISKQEKSKNNARHEIQYFAAPNEQGEFIAKNGQSEVKQGASIYKFFIKGTDADFEFFNHDSTFQSTLNAPNRLNAVCNFANDYNPDATKIKTTRKGKAILEDDKWVVKQKAEINYEA